MRRKSQNQCWHVVIRHSTRITVRLLQFDHYILHLPKCAVLSLHLHCITVRSLDHYKLLTFLLFQSTTARQDRRLTLCFSLIATFPLQTNARAQHALQQDRMEKSGHSKHEVLPREMVAKLHPWEPASVNRGFFWGCSGCLSWRKENNFWKAFWYSVAIEPPNQNSPARLPLGRRPWPPC